MTASGARIGGLEFVADGRDAMFTLDDDALSEWLETPEMRRQRTERPVGHGEFPAPGYLSGRVIPFSGLMFADSPEQYVHRAAKLSGLLAGGGEGRLVVDLEFGSTWADVSRHGTTKVVPEVWGSIARYQMYFWAADAERYGETRTFTGTTVEAFHYGNFDAYPPITVTGVGAYTISGPGGKQFIVSSPLAGGQTDVIDFKRGWVRRNGVLLMTGVSRAETWPVTPGLPATPFSITTGFTMSIPVTDTWV